MRGSLKTQITAALKCCCKIGASRHIAKQEHGGRSPFIHSMGTFDRTARRLWPLADWLKARGIKDLELLNDSLVRDFLEERLRYHTERGNSRQTFKVEVAALGNLERGLNLFAEYHRSSTMPYNFSSARSSFSCKARCLEKRTSTYDFRALPDPLALIAALDEHHHKLMASLQYYCGCRAEGVGAPERHYPGGNRLRLENFQEAGRLSSMMLDTVTGERMRPFWTKEKGGKVAWKYCPQGLAVQVLDWLKEHPEGLGDTYRNYLDAINTALERTGQAQRGKGTHALRFNFAQRRYRQCLKAGMGDEEAKRLVSREMSHNRPDITEGYYA